MRAKLWTLTNTRMNMRISLDHPTPFVRQVFAVGGSAVVAAVEHVVGWAARAVQEVEAHAALMQFVGLSGDAPLQICKTA